MHLPEKIVAEALDAGGAHEHVERGTSCRGGHEVCGDVVLCDLARRRMGR